MPELHIPNLDEKAYNRLRVRAGEHSRSIEDEARSLIENALSETMRNNQSSSEDFIRQMRDERDARDSEIARYGALRV